MHSKYSMECPEGERKYIHTLFHLYIRVLNIYKLFIDYCRYISDFLNGKIGGHVSYTFIDYFYCSDMIPFVMFFRFCATVQDKLLPCSVVQHCLCLATDLPCSVVQYCLCWCDIASAVQHSLCLATCYSFLL
ncbi:hypothetical protein I3760_03G117600 [Carya illinoinensis]|nr:hypothetical protein I3760_03G117600 [Carya illinoinensis]